VTGEAPKHPVRRIQGGSTARAALASLAVHGALIGAAWHARWRLAPTDEPRTAAAKVEASLPVDAAGESLSPLELPALPVDPPPVDSAADPLAIEVELEPIDSDPPAGLATEPAFAIGSPQDQRPPLHRIRRRPPGTDAAQDVDPIPAAAPPPAPDGTDPALPPSLPSEPVVDTVEIADAATESAPPPAYPRRAIEQKLVGEVVLLALVRADGSVGACEIETSSGHSLLDAAAKAALLRWKFRPRMRDGSPRPFTARVPFQFRLKSRPEGRDRPPLPAEPPAGGAPA
jgi:protein TonB